MKKSIFVIITLLVLVLFSSCRDDMYISEEFTTIRKEISDISEIEVRDIYLKQKNTYFGANIYLIGGEEEFISMTVSVDLVDRIKFDKNGDKLTISASRYDNYVTKSVDIYLYGYSFDKLSFSNVVLDIKKEALKDSNLDFNFSGATKANIESINCNKLDFNISGASKVKINSASAITCNTDLSGASRLEFTECNFTDLDFNISGASNCSIDSINAKEAEINLSGASIISSVGSLEKLHLILSGASHASLLKTTIDNGRTNISGASTLKISFTDYLDAYLSGASELEYYTETGKLDVDKSSSCIVEKVTK